MNRELVPSKGDELVEVLYELEEKKHDALVRFDADAYEAGVSEQVCLLGEDDDLLAQTSSPTVSRLADLASTLSCWSTSIPFRLILPLRRVAIRPSAT